jgi:hypothetical protein
MNDLVSQYVEIRDSLMGRLDQMVDVYLTEIWDPLMKFLIVKELQKMITTELAQEFPDFPIKYLPHVKIKIDEDNRMIEAGLQYFFNSDTHLNYLGNIEHAGGIFDLYYRDSWDPMVKHIFYARNGHDENSYEKGSKTAEAEYFMGMMTPLSIAYSFALEDGIIKTNPDECLF